MNLPAFLLAVIPTLLLAADFPEPADLPPIQGLPDPLRTQEGKAITTRGEWEGRRKPELRGLFQRYMYGQMPMPTRVERGPELLVEDKGAFDGAATLREFAVDIGLGAPVHLLVVTPNGSAESVPAFLGLNFNGNHQLLSHPGIALPKSWVRPARDGSGSGAAQEEDRGKEKDVWNIEMVVKRGYAFASFYQGDVVPDEPKLAEASLQQLNPQGPGDDVWNTSGFRPGAIAAWAWGFSQMLTALEKVSEIDAKRVAAVGHSRNGKTALLAAAFDERFALAIPSQAGSGGTGPSRVAPDLAKPNANGRPTAETVAVITKSFPHWFCKNFAAFGDATDRLPFDQHSLIALCAPRPVLISNATEDRWANPAGQFEMLAAAAPVYRIVSGESDVLATEQMPGVGQLVNSRLGVFLRTGKHSMTTEDWAAWLDYTDKWLK